MEELGVQIALTFEVGEWSAKSFVIKKYVVDANEEMLALCKKLTAVFSHKAFGVLPEKIEIVNLIEGTRHSYAPKEQDMIEGMDDLYRMKEMLQQPEHYTDRTFCSECIGCAFRIDCKVDEVQEGLVQKKIILH